LKTGHRRSETENKDGESRESEDTNPQNNQSDVLSKIEVDQEENAEEIEESVAAACVIDDTDEENTEGQMLKEGINMELYNTVQKENVQINEKLTKEQKNRLMKLVEEYQDMFSDVPRATHLIDHKRANTF